MPQFLTREVVTIALAMGSSVVERFTRMTRPVAKAARGPLLLAKLAVAMLAVVAGGCLRALARPFATPLGVANLAAVAVLAGDLAGMPAASLAVLAGLPAMILMLLVNVSETEMADRPH